jgi:hypothetical protein
LERISSSSPEINIKVLDPLKTFYKEEKGKRLGKDNSSSIGISYLKFDLKGTKVLR